MEKNKNQKSPQEQFKVEEFIYSNGYECFKGWVQFKWLCTNLWLWCPVFLNDDSKLSVTFPTSRFTNTRYDDVDGVTVKSVCPGNEMDTKTIEKNMSKAFHEIILEELKNDYKNFKDIELLIENNANTVTEEKENIQNEKVDFIIADGD